jgi:hypothetical protein
MGTSPVDEPPSTCRLPVVVKSIVRRLYACSLPTIAGALPASVPHARTCSLPAMAGARALPATGSLLYRCMYNKASANDHFASS